MWNGMRSSRSAVLSPLYFIPYFVFENFIVLNLIVAVILETLEFEEGEKKVKQEEKAVKMTRFLVPPSVYFAKVFEPIAQRLPRLPCSGCLGMLGSLCIFRRNKAAPIAPAPPASNNQAKTQQNTAWSEVDSKTPKPTINAKKPRANRASRIILQNNMSCTLNNIIPLRLVFMAMPTLNYSLIHHRMTQLSN